MKRTISSLLSLSLAFAPSVYGWGVKPGNTDTPPGALKMGGVNNPEIHLHGDDENGYLKFSYLLFRPNLDETAFATIITNPFAQFGSDGSIKAKSPHFDWSSGARLNIGMYLPHYDLWDIGLTTTFYYSEANNHASTPPFNFANPIPAFITPQLFQGVLGDVANKASGNWKMNFFIYDLGLAREYFLTPKLTARPYLGIRGMTLYQTLRSRYTSLFHDIFISPDTQTVKTKFSATQDTWGVGVKAATDIAFQLPGHFSIIGNFGGSLLYGHFKARQKINGRAHPLLNQYNPTVTNHGYDLESSIEGTFGLKWERWFPSNNNRVALSACFEAQQWFDINKLARIDVTPLSAPFPGFGVITFPVANLNELNGDLTLVGFTFALQWDF